MDVEVARFLGVAGKNQAMQNARFARAVRTVD
jgi:hypothetical protein